MLYFNALSLQCSVRELCGGVLEGGVFGSTEIVFRPGQLLGGQFYADTESAGAICLLGKRASIEFIFFLVQYIPTRPVFLSRNH
jgi:RNA 3'-terminal phosphate cyclase